MPDEQPTQQPQQPARQQPRAAAPKADPIADALRKSSTLVLTLASALQARSTNGESQPSIAVECCSAVVGDECKARMVSEVKDMRLRQGDEIVVCAPGRDGKYTLSTPLKIDDHWNAELYSGAGGIVGSSFFGELAKRALPLTVKRRTDENGMFWLDWA